MPARNEPAVPRPDRRRRRPGRRRSCLYNWMQERRARRRVDAAFQAAAGRALERERVEPQLPAATAGAERRAPRSMAADTDDELAADAQRAGVDGATRLLSIARDARRARERSRPMRTSNASCVWLRRSRCVPKPLACCGRRRRSANPVAGWLGAAATSPWQALTDGAPGGPWQEIAACMLLANRAGAASRADIETFPAPDRAVRRGSTSGGLRTA